MTQFFASRAFRWTALILTFSLVFIAPAFSQTFKVATGSAKGTYASMFKELQGACGNDVTMSEVASTGSNQNVDMLVGNQVNAAFVQTDVLHWRGRTEDLSAVKTLLALHREAVHLVARANSGIKQGGTLGFGKTEVVLSDITSLAGLVVGAAGGSLTTAQVIRMQSEVKFDVQEFDTNDLALKALDAGTVQAVVLVGGAPLPSVAAMGPAYKLLAIPAAIAERLKNVYRPITVNYSKLKATGLQTVSTDALFVTREYKTQKMVEGLARFRACALAKVDELKETTGTHPAWQAVEPSNRGKWAYYELPEPMKVSGKGRQ